MQVKDMRMKEHVFLKQSRKEKFFVGRVNFG